MPATLDRELRRLLTRAGCTFVRAGKGSHQIRQSPIIGRRFRFRSGSSAATQRTACSNRQACRGHSERPPPARQHKWHRRSRSGGTFGEVPRGLSANPRGRPAVDNYYAGAVREQLSDFAAYIAARRGADNSSRCIRSIGQCPYPIAPSNHGVGFAICLPTLAIAAEHPGSAAQDLPSS